MTEAFHEGNEKDHAEYVQANKDLYYQEGVMQASDDNDHHKNQNGEVIVETNEEVQYETTQVSSAHYGEIEATQYSPELPISSTDQTVKIKPRNEPIITITSKLPVKSTKPTTTKRPKSIPETTEQQLSQEKSTVVTTEKPLAESGSSNLDNHTTPSSTSVSSPTPPLLPTSSKPNGSTTVKPEATSTASPPTSSSIPLTEKPMAPPNNLYCLCDHYRHSCDMNCCCDIDCSEEERSVFSHCEDGAGLHDKKSAIRRQRSCYQSFVFFKHFETYNLHRTDSGLLCILRDNNRDDNELPSPVIDELNDNILKENLNIRKKYEWSRPNNIEYKLTPYQYGSPILGVKSSEMSMDLAKKLLEFGLPASYHGSSCTIYEPIRFLEDVQSRCYIKVKNLTRECEEMSILNGNHVIDNLNIIGNPGDADPQLMSIIRSKQCNDELCTSDDNDIEIGEFSSPTLNREKQICQDVLKSLDITIFHEGIDGISEIVAKAHLQNVPLRNTQVFQEYRVNFIWAREIVNSSSNSTEDIEDWPRSGNPGYMVGKPIIMGEKVKVLQTFKNQSTATPENDGHELVVEENILVWNDPSRWMTILGPGICSKHTETGHRRSVLFDFGQSSTCSLNLTKYKYCEDLQMDVAKILLGSDDPESFEKRAWRVAAYGNSNPDDLSDWVKLTYKTFPIISTSEGSSKSLISKGCEGIFSSLHITIVYAFVGSIDFPQARISRVLYELGESIPVSGVQTDLCTKMMPCQSHNMLSQLSVSTSVTFKDGTTPPLTRVAKWPVVSIRLPADFFYPFSSPSSATHERSIISYFVAFISVNVILKIYLCVLKT